MQTFLYLLITGTFIGCNVYSLSAQADRVVGGRCEGCEALHDRSPARMLASDTLDGYGERGTPLHLFGTVRHASGAPAGGVILYVYHTNERGLYEAAPTATGFALRHGQHRGWVKTGADGRYDFFTFRPASYPNSGAPAHIHLTVKEPGTIAHYLDDFLFTDDPFLTPKVRATQPGRGGSGICTPNWQKGAWRVQRDICLGQAVPGY